MHHRFNCFLLFFFLLFSVFFVVVVFVVFSKSINRDFVLR